MKNRYGINKRNRTVCTGFKKGGARVRNFFPFMTTSTEVTGIRADLIYTNYVIACLLPLFVIFLCIRMVSSTKKAGVLTFLLSGVFAAWHREEIQPAVISFIHSVASNPPSAAGVILACLGACGLLKGLYDEEQSEQYVHRRIYWYGIIGMIYMGIFIAIHYMKQS